MISNKERPFRVEPNTYVRCVEGDMYAGGIISGLPRSMHYFAILCNVIRNRPYIRVEKTRWGFG